MDGTLKNSRPEAMPSATSDFIERTDAADLASEADASADAALAEVIRRAPSIVIISFPVRVTTLSAELFIS